MPPTPSQAISSQGSKLDPISLSDSDEYTPSSSRKPPRRYSQDASAISIRTKGTLDSSRKAGPSSGRRASGPQPDAIDLTLSSDNDERQPSSQRIKPSPKTPRAIPSEIIHEEDLDSRSTRAQKGVIRRPSSQPRHPVLGGWGNPASLVDPREMAQAVQNTQKASQSAPTSGSSRTTPVKRQHGSFSRTVGGSRQVGESSGAQKPALGGWGNFASLESKEDMDEIRARASQKPVPGSRKRNTPERVEPPNVTRSNAATAKTKSPVRTTGAIGTWGNFVQMGLATIGSSSRSAAPSKSTLEDGFVIDPSLIDLRADDLPPNKLDNQSTSEQLETSHRLDELVRSEQWEQPEQTHDPIGDMEHSGEGFATEEDYSAKDSQLPERPLHLQPISTYPPPATTPSTPTPGSWGNFISLGHSTIPKRPLSASKSPPSNRKRPRSAIPQTAETPPAELSAHDIVPSLETNIVRPLTNRPTWATKSPVLLTQTSKSPSPIPVPNPLFDELQDELEQSLPEEIEPPLFVAANASAPEAQTDAAVICSPRDLYQDLQVSKPKDLKSPPEDSDATTAAIRSPKANTPEARKSAQSLAVVESNISDPVERGIPLISGDFGSHATESEIQIDTAATDADTEILEAESGPGIPTENSLDVSSAGAEIGIAPLTSTEDIVSVVNRDVSEPPRTSSPAPSTAPSVQEIDQHGQPVKTAFTLTPVKPPGMDTIQWLRLKAKMRREGMSPRSKVETPSPLSAVFPGNNRPLAQTDTVMEESAPGVMSREEWRKVVEEDGASDVEILLGPDGTSPPASGLSHDRSNTYLGSYTVDLSRLSDPTHAPPPDRRGVAKREFNNFEIDRWNGMLPTLTQNAALHRVVFETYIQERELESGPIPVVNEVDKEGAPPDMEFEYSNEMLYSQAIPDPEKSLGCTCIGPCDPKSKTCTCVRRQELYFYGISDLQGFAYDAFGRVKNLSVPIWECSETCGCPPECMNRVIQKGRNPATRLEIVKTKKKGWGVQAATRIPRGTFIGIYAGEVITDAESEARGELYSEIGRTYLFDLDGWQIRNPPSGLRDIDPRLADIAEASAERAKLAIEDFENPNYVYNAYSVDAFHYGYTRYFNHSCDPNMEITQCYVKDFHPERPILVIFARRDIKAEEELCISYKGIPDEEEDLEPEILPAKKDTGKKGKKRQSKTSASAHISTNTSVSDAKAKRNACYCGTKRCDGKMFNL